MPLLQLARLPALCSSAGSLLGARPDRFGLRRLPQRRSAVLTVQGAVSCVGFQHVRHLCQLHLRRQQHHHRASRLSGQEPGEAVQLDLLSRPQLSLQTRHQPGRGPADDDALLAGEPGDQGGRAADSAGGRFDGAGGQQHGGRPSGAGGGPEPLAACHWERQAGCAEGRGWLPQAGERLWEEEGPAAVFWSR